MTVLYLLVVFLAFSLIVLIHEFGHFLAGKICKVKIEVFSIGVGKRLWGFKWGETDFRFSMLPFGGFVAFSGISDTEGVTSDAHSPDEFPSKPAYQKIFISVAGPFFNLVTGFILAVLLFAYGVQFTSPEVGSVYPGSPAATAGLQKGDKIIRVNGRLVNGFTDVQQDIALTDPGKEIEFTIDREGQEKVFVISPVKPKDALFPTIGITPPTSNTIQLNGSMKDDGFEQGDSVISINGIAVDYKTAYEVLEREVRANADKVLPIVVERDGESVSIEIKPRPIYTYKTQMGLMPPIESVSPGSPAENAGIKQNDCLLAINGQNIENWASLLSLLRDVEGEVAVSVLRDGERIEFQITPILNDDGRKILGVTAKSFTENLVVTWVEPDSAASKAGIVPGMKVSHFDMTESGEMKLKTEQCEFSVQAQRDESVTPEGHYEFGFLVKYDTVRAQSFGEAIVRGFNGCIYIVDKTYLFLAKLVSAKLSPTLVSGPVGIINISYKVLSVSLSFFLYFLVLISINLAIVNLLPLPLLDGGNVIIYAVEWIKGSPINQTLHKYIIYSGLVFIIGLFLFVTGNDIYRLIFGY